MTRAAIDRLVAVFQKHQHSGLDVAIRAVLAAAEHQTDEPLPVTPATRMAARAIIESVSYRHGIPVAEVLSKSRLVDVVRARWECMAELRALRFSHDAIARFLRRDHSTVISGLRKFAAENPGHVPVADELAVKRAMVAA